MNESKSVMPVASDNEMETRPFALKIRGLSKKYRYGLIGGRTLQEEIQSWWARKRGKEDPNTIIGTDTSMQGKDFLALDEINLDVHQGEALGIIGANGAGKSTLLKLISQVTAPSEGEIDLYGRVTSMLEVGIGFSPEMTGRENIYLNGMILGMSKREIDEKIEEIIDFSEIRDFIDTPVKRYSSGMYVKLAFSVAAHLNSEIIIMDEVLAVGDMAFQKKCLEKMKSVVSEEGRTILYVSHNMNTIRRLCSRCIVLEKGRIVFDGDVEEAISVYMDHSASIDETDIDLTGKEHFSDLTLPGVNDPVILMEHIVLEGKMIPYYEFGENLDMTLTLRVMKPIKSVMIRITLRTSTDDGVGTAWSQEMNFEKPGTYQMKCCMDLGQVEKGIFYASVGIYQSGEHGGLRAADHITRAFKLETQGTSLWSADAFGHVLLKPILCENICEIIGPVPNSGLKESAK